MPVKSLERKSPQGTKSKSTRNAIIVVITAIIYFVLVNLRTPEGLTIEGQKAIALMICALIFWILEVMPLAPSCLLFAVLQPIVGTVTFPQAASNFMPTTFFFCLSCFLIGQALLDTGLGNRVVLILLRASKNKPKRMLFLIMCVTSLISFVIANLALSAMMVPLLMKIFKDNDMKIGESKFAKACLIGVPIAISIGGCATPAGALPNYQAMALANEVAGSSIGFIDWFTLGAPLAVILTPIAYLLVVWIFKPEVNKLVDVDVHAQIKELGSLNGKEIGFIVIFALLIASWFLTKIPMPISAMIATAIFFLPKIEILDAEGFKKSVNWNVLMLVCASTALGLAIFQTGAAQWIATSVLSPFVHTGPLVMIAILILFTIYLHLLIPVNPSLVAVLIPIVVLFAPTMGLPAVAFALPVAYAVNCAALLPLDPVFVMTYSTGAYTMRDLPKVGVPLSIVWMIVGTAIMMIAL